MTGTPSSGETEARASVILEQHAGPLSRAMARLRGHNFVVANLLMGPTMLWLVLFLILPLGVILVYSFGSRGTYGDVILGFSFDNYLRAFNPTWLPIILRSFGFAAVATILTLLLGYPLAYFIAVYGGRRKNIYLIMVMLPFWTSYLIRTYSWIVILRSQGVINTVLMWTHLTSNPIEILNTPYSVILGLTYGFLPFMTLPLYASLEKLDKSLIEAAWDLGATRFWALMKVTIPLSLPGIIAGTLLTFIPAVGDFITPDLLGGPNTMMIGNLIQQQFLSARDWAYGSALSFSLMAILLLGIFFYVRKAGAENLA
ncbi:MAG TPA: ABC transporter permease [Thermoleophilia bacterium]|nr:ABC transporter permease [Thermoleophilia bacterium]